MLWAFKEGRDVDTQALQRTVLLLISTHFSSSASSLSYLFLPPTLALDTRLLTMGKTQRRPRISWLLRISRHSRVTACPMVFQ